MGNRVTHAYFGIDYKIIWKIVKEELPRLKPEIESILREIEKKTKRIAVVQIRAMSGCADL